MSFSAFRDIMGNTEEQRRTFFKLVFGPDATGYICISILEHTTRRMNNSWFEYPARLEEMLEFINNSTDTLSHFWFSTALYNEAGTRQKYKIKMSTMIHCDLDECDPRLLLVEPSVLIQSSPGKFQAIWILDRPVAPQEAEDVNRRIAYYHRDQGADTCHDAGHLLRIPYTPNYKYGEIGTAPVVGIIHAKRNLYRVSDFSRYPNLKALKFMDKQDELPDLPKMTADEIINHYRPTLQSAFYPVFQQRPEADDAPDSKWSGILFRLMSYCLEAGMRREETFVVAKASACNKYDRDNRSDLELWRDVLRVYVKQIEKMNLAPTTTSEIPVLLTEEETAQVQNRVTFIERYIEWAKTITDAPMQYHIAGAFITLSAMLSGNISLRTSHSLIHPNLWFMILSGTTLTRKSTAMRISMKLLSEVDERAEMATDGSMEGILVGLRDRPGQPSIFLKDEFTGLLEAIAHKDYMAGFAEQLTKLYDGDDVRRLLRKETIHVRDPRFIIFAAGIKEKTQMLLTEEHVMSGFIPRFVFISADAKIEDLNPTGPPREDGLDNETRELLKNELTDMHNHYVKEQTITLEGKVIDTVPVQYEATLTNEAWARFQVFEKQMRDTAISTGLGYLVPVYERLSMSTLKAAILIAATKKREKGLTIDTIDVLHAIYYAQRWREYASEIVSGIGKTFDERLMDRIMAYIRSSPTGSSRAELMRAFSLDIKRADILFGTLVQRKLVYVLDVAGNKRYRATDGSDI